MTDESKSTIQKLLTAPGAILKEYPRQFWVLVVAAFIDRLGGAMLFPFFTLYMTKKFDINMTTVGAIFFAFAFSSFLGSMVGGALTDRLGRKGMLLFGLVMSALSALLMGITNQIGYFVLVAVVVGMLADAGGPAQSALVADLLPENKRAEGFGILRVVFNLAVVIGPLLGGLLASRSYMLLFIADAITSSITALVVYFTLHETWHPNAEGKAEEPFVKTFAGYGKVLRDKAYVWYLLASAVMVLVYMQMNTTLAVYLRDYHSVNEQGFSYILSLNAAMVVLFQFPITRWIERYRPLLVMTAGAVLYAVGFALYGITSVFFMFMVAMAIITIGEMFVSPVGQAIVTRLAPEEMRGRYMAVFGFSWLVPYAFGPLLAGLVLDNLNPSWLWYAAGFLGLVSAGGFYLLEWLGSRSRWSAVDQRLDIMEKLEQGHISAQAANQMLEKVNEGAWARLSPAPPASERRHMHIQISDLSSGIMKVDLRLPLGLVNTVLYAGGHLSSDLDNYNGPLTEMIAQSAAQGISQKGEASGDHVELTVE
jgi:MFS family permease